MWFRDILRRKRRQADPAGPLFDDTFLRRLERLSLQARRELRGTPAGGAHLSRQRRPTTIFSEHRPYSPGDDYRTIDWHVYAHLDEIFVKMGEVEQDIAVHLLLDVSRSMGWGQPSKLRAGQQLVAALGYLALAHSDRLQVTPFGSQLQTAFGPAQGKNRVIDLMRFLEALRPDQPTALGAALAAYGATRARGGLLVICSDLLAPEGLEQGLRALPARRWQVLVLHMLDRRELTPELAGPLELQDAETGERLQLTLDARALAAYRRNIATWLEQIAQTCARRGVTYAQVLTDWPLERAVVPFLRTRGIIS